MGECPKSIDGLMRYLRDQKGISIKGSLQKRKLRNLGYYHGYKGYRYIREPQKYLVFSDFDEILALNNFDMRLKALFYPHVMFIETAIKNYVLETIIRDANSNSFNEIYNDLLTVHREKKNNKELIKSRLELRNKIHRALSNDYGNSNQIVSHFYDRDESVPIWGIFERLCLGDFAKFVSTLNSIERKKISNSIGLNPACDTDYTLTHTIIYVIKDLRNAIAHNDVIFDTRFRQSNIKNTVPQCLMRSTKVKNITFTSIIDYVVLICYLLKILKVQKTEINRLILDFEIAISSLKSQIGDKEYFPKIVFVDNDMKINALKEYIKS